MKLEIGSPKSGSKDWKLRLYIYKTMLLLFFISSFYFPISVHSAEFYFGTNSKEVSVGQTFEVGVFLNTTGQPINTFGSEIIVDGTVFDITDIREGNSFVSLWIDRPKITENTVIFSGTIPGGYNGNEAFLFSLILTAKKAGVGKIASSNDQIFLHDGNGTSAPVMNAPLTLTVFDTGVTQTYIPPVDEIPPESFVPQIGQDSALFEGNYFIAFATQDKQSGVDTFEIWESYRKYDPEKLEKKKGVDWKKSVSPAVLEDQSLRRYVYVRATDYAGNIRIVRLSPTYPSVWYENHQKSGILVLIVILIFVRVFLYYRRKKGHS